MCLYLQFRETLSNQEVGSPVGETRNGHGSRSGPLGEELSHNKPGDGTRTHLKTGNKAKDSHNGQVVQRWVGGLLRDRNKQRKRCNKGGTA